MGRTVLVSESIGWTVGILFQADSHISPTLEILMEKEGSGKKTLLNGKGISEWWEVAKEHCGWLDQITTTRARARYTVSNLFHLEAHLDVYLATLYIITWPRCISQSVTRISRVSARFTSQSRHSQDIPSRVV